MKMINWILKRKLLIIGALSLIITANAQNSTYINNHKSISTELSEQYGIPSSLILAVALVESSSGNGKAARKLNNHFGIVGKNSMREKGYRSRYKQYKNDNESFLDFCRLVSNKKFYSRLKDNNNPGEWVKALSHAGYSTQPELWEKKILNTISVNRL
ncbi:MAG: glucosaminidase domain-containing protein [Taibaiella sp.]|nr:glucosaminidase domain-containing protein [Taibaiella sp.]